MRKLGFIVFTFMAAGLGIMAGLEADRALNPVMVQQFAKDDAATLEAVRPQSVSFTGAKMEAPVDFREAVKRVIPAVVSVDKRERVRRFFLSDETEILPTGSGSGVIIGKDGYILTNFHVVENAVSLQVRLSDGRSFPGKYIGGDRRADLAVLKIEATDLKPAALADSSQLDIGEWVIAVGNPLGYSNTVSVGVVSSLKRSLPTGKDSWLIDSIQTDAAINGGNSGGALANGDGEVVGINTAIATNTGGSVGIGFAIPINRAKRVVADILKYGRVRYGEPGMLVYPRSDLLTNPGTVAELTDIFGTKPPAHGLLTMEVYSNSPAAKAGIRRLDVILDIDGTQLDDPNQFSRIFVDKRPGDTVKVRFWRAGEVKTVDLVLMDLERN